MVRVKKKSVKTVQVFSVVQGLIHRSQVIKIDRITPEGLGQQRKVFVGIMMLALVSKKKNTNGVGA